MEGAGKRIATALVTGVAVLLVDLASKAVVRSTLEQGSAVPILGDLVRFDLGFNSGIAFGVLADGGAALVWLTALIGLALVGWLIASARAGAGYRRTVPLGLVIGGAFANVADRLPDGLVTDFIDVGIGAVRWPSFNLADSAIVVGVLTLVVVGFEIRGGPETSAR